jgi:hypothetical protein
MKKKSVVSSTPIPEPIRRKIRGKILKMEEEMRKLPGAMIGDCMPLRHTFGDGIYVREMFAPKGYLIVTKIHKLAHPFFVLKGDVSVMTEAGPVRVRAPYHGMTPAGTKRVCYTHEDTIWITVHPTKERDIDKIEEEVIAKSYEELGIEVDEVKEDKEIENFIKAITKKEEEK